MTFEMAIVLMKQGKMVRRSEHPEGAYFQKLKNTIVFYDPEIKRYYSPDFSGYDILAEDWEVIE